jgi:hypothetical protein
MTNINARGPFEYATALLDPAGWTRGGGEIAIMNGKPVLWAGPAMGWQSPESFGRMVQDPQAFERMTGSRTPAEVYAKASYMEGFDPDKARPAAKPPKQPVGGAADESGTVTPGTAPPAPTLPPPPSTTLPPTAAPYSGTTIPQQQDETVKGLFDYLKELGDPERLRQVEDMRLQNLLKSQLLTSELTRQGERARYARDIEKANIDAWKERQIAMYNANAAMAAGLGAATVAAFAPPNASALSSTLSAAMQPFSNIGVRKG